MNLMKCFAGMGMKANQLNQMNGSIAQAASQANKEN